jgi:hypothetical protein
MITYIFKVHRSYYQWKNTKEGREKRIKSVFEGCCNIYIHKKFVYFVKWAWYGGKKG